ncbi:sulfotransferase family protein [Psychromonas sp. B3M02]|uniref:sulfotransferase family protein n=1 Tax=Psychromonas sp. B3M02 TaxID=2267226 RepID=UPI000DEAEFD8|nr:sulfotransferase family protein [Psychromonas sp. B3M02]RBW45710.1 sulfotransferase family protein [Psychromonas sp. B3M02]
MSKIFIIGLPRTGTTSISVAFLNLGYKVAHTAFTKQSFVLADVVTDCPCFSDYQQLDKLFPGARFVYLTRDLTNWLPSVQGLLKKMLPKLDTNTGDFSPVLKRSFNETFDLTSPDLLNEQHLIDCYQTHQQQVLSYFAGRTNFLSIDISETNSYSQLCEFLTIPHALEDTFPHVNKGQQVAHWKAVKHSNKISSFCAGPDHRQFLEYNT